MNFNRFTLLDLLNALGDEKVSLLLNSFQCPQNNEVVHFIKKSAVNFAKRKITATHLILDDERQFRAFFSLTHKPITISEENLSPKIRRLLEKYASYNPVKNRFEASGYLIAQLSKNYTYDTSEIDGTKLIDTIIQILLPIQHEIGGRIVYLECDSSRPKLIKFYENNNFITFRERHDENDNTTYVQMLRIL